jgi:hypothetical protein
MKTNLKVGEKKFIAIGNFQLGNTVMVSDPSYAIGIWCQAKLDNVKFGEYVGFAEMIHDADWGVRVARLFALNKEFMKIEYWDWELSGNEIGVDSGQAGIFDLSTYRNDSVKIDNVPENALFDSLKNDEEGSEWYLNLTKITLDNDYAIYSNGIVSRSGIGDGGYSLFTTYENGEVIGMCIDFHLDIDDEGNTTIKNCWNENL